MVYISGFALY